MRPMSTTLRTGLHPISTKCRSLASYPEGDYEWSENKYEAFSAQELREHNQTAEDNNNAEYDPWKLLAPPANSQDRRIEHWDAWGNAVSWTGRVVRSPDFPEMTVADKTALQAALGHPVQFHLRGATQDPEQKMGAVGDLDWSHP